MLMSDDRPRVSDILCFGASRPAQLRNEILLRKGIVALAIEGVQDEESRRVHLMSTKR